MSSTNNILRTLRSPRIQEKLLDEFSDAGRVPRTLTCEVAADLVDMVIPGDVISVSGIVKYVQLHDRKYSWLCLVWIMLQMSTPIR